MENKTQKIFPKKRGPGVWIERPRRCEILICSCGNKYIKTRKDQIVCVRCINKARTAKQ